jgi:LPXTG-motif cell wall-anchored protein
MLFNRNENHLKTKEHGMRSFISLALLIVGIVLIILGIQASDSLGSDLSNFFSGSPTDKAMWILLGGIVAAVVGLGGVLLRRRVR